MNECPHPQTTTRIVPIEFLGTTPPGRITQAPWHTCVRCGASFYKPETLHQAPDALPAPQHAPIHDDYC